jgi:uncharacterized protein with ParB-like and HNH nuclease domain
MNHPHEENMNKELMTVPQLFKDRYFRIPEYQRGYTWEQKQLEDLVKDINHIRSVEHKHYTGTIVISWNKEFQKFDIVDGQQRITTLIIMLKVIDEVFPEKFPEITNMCISRGDDKFVLETNTQTNRFFIEAILGTNQRLNKDIKSLSNLDFAKKYLAAWVQDNKDNITDIYATITTKLGFLCFAPENSAEIGIMFEVINNRGKPLSELEKIKNYFIYYATIHGKKGLKNKINETWGEILKNLNEAKVTSNDDENSFLRNCYIVFYSTNKSKSWYVYNELKQLYKPDDPKNLDNKFDEIERFIEFILHAAQSYTYLFRSSKFQDYYKGEHSVEMARVLKRLRCHPVNASILPLYLAGMFYFDERPEDTLKLLNLLEIVNFRVYVLPNAKVPRADSNQGKLFQWAHDLFWERDWDSREREEIVLTHLKQSIEGNIYNYVRMMLTDFTLDLCSRKTLVQSLTVDRDESINYYSWQGLRFFLASYEEQLAAEEQRTWNIEKILLGRDEAQKMHRLNDYLSREHIWASENRAEDFPKNHHEKRRLGNFVLLGLKKNIQQSDHDIKDKIRDLANHASTKMQHVSDLDPLYVDAIKYLDQEVGWKRRTKFYYRDLATRINDQRENRLITFALQRWALSEEEIMVDVIVDSFIAKADGKNECFYFPPELISSEI